LFARVEPLPLYKGRTERHNERGGVSITMGVTEGEKPLLAHILEGLGGQEREGQEKCFQKEEKEKKKTVIIKYLYEGLDTLTYRRGKRPLC